MPTNGVNTLALHLQQKNDATDEIGSSSTFFKIHGLQERKSPVFNAKARSIQIEIKSLPAGENFASSLNIRMKEVFDCLTDECDESDLMSFKIVTNAIEFEPDDKTFKPMGKLSHVLLENLIQNMAREKVFDVGDSFEICVKCVKMIDESSKCGRCGCFPACTKILNEIKCHDCLFDFYGPECYENHLGNSLFKGCKWNKKCSTCKKTYFNFEEHSCYCTACRSYYTADHKCYMSRLNTVSNQNDLYKSAFLFYDFETMQEKYFAANEKLHEVNLCVAQLVCHACFNSDLEERCDSCQNGQTFIFKNKPVEKLVTLIRSVKLPSHIKRLVCIAHNSKDYDGQFILKYLLQQTDIKPFIIMNGNSIIFMSFKNDHSLEVKFVDSFSYFDMKLAKLPQTFRFENTYKKGSFPYLFNTTENQDYIGRLPDQKYYGLDKMNGKELSDFQEWHKKLREENYIFNFKKEIVEYCRMDVEILRKACYTFRDMFIRLANIDPFVEGASMATICMKVFRTKFLKPDTIGIIPNGGYRKRARLSVEWLLIVEKEFAKELVHIGRGSEYRINDDIIVDGYVCKDGGSKNVYQFYECSWHGCLECFDSDRDERIEGFGDSYNLRYEKTISIENTIQKMGYDLKRMWECGFEKMRETHKQFLLNHPMLTKDFLNPRDAFYGGRVETYMAHRAVVGDEKIHYIDICSLYPWVNKYRKVPVGHPKVYFGNRCKFLAGADNDLTRVEGLVKCRVLAPRNLYHPVLPIRINDRTMFSLCRLCCENSEKGECHHEDIADREFTGTWVSDELKKAVEMGYQITRIYEIWQYKVEQYDPLKKVGGVFTDYVNEFLRIKQSASGWPADCTTSEARERYVEEFEEREGIRLTPKENPGLRFIGKRALNSLWGKLGERDYGNTEILRSLADLRSITSSSEKDLVDLQIMNNKSGYCKWMAKDEYKKVKEYTNVAIAAYTAAQARLKLYSYLKRLGDQVLYCHTDSCVYVSSPEKGQEEIETGNFLGDMTDELAKDYGKGSYIREFVSCGSNLYSMIVVKPDGTEEVIRKGVPLNSSCNVAYSHENMKALALGKKDIIECSYSDIRRTKDHDVVTCEKKKSSRTSFLKRRYPDESKSYPFGYKERKID